jgi:hypothetical protein
MSAMMKVLFAAQPTRVRASAVVHCVVAIFLGTALLPLARAAEAPHLVQKDGRYALFVDGQPYLILGGQIHNSSAWPYLLPEVWDSMAALHANTIEAPVYWEVLEPQEGHFDFSNVDAIVDGARTHHLHVVLLWFGTWKNGNMHYVPSWVKTDTGRFPRVIRRDGQPIDVLSALSRNNLNADKAAFVALMRHLNQIDSQQHTVLLVQVENESGIVGSVRDYSAEADREIAGQVPADLLAAAHKQGGTWSQVFGADADEIFQVYHQTRYINEIAAAGKKEFDVPCYINVWPDPPTAELPQRALELPGIAYPSGGAVQKLVGLWRALAPSIDMIGPDIYSTDSDFYRATMRAYERPDNPLWIPETGSGNNFGKFFFYALGDGAIGFSPFGVDHPNGFNPSGAANARMGLLEAHARNFALIGPMDREIASLEFEGKVKTAVEEPGKVSEELDFGDWQATVAFGFPQMDGRRPPGTKDADGVALVARLGTNEFLVTGFNASVIFHLPGKLPWMRSEFLSVEQGEYVNGVWKPLRLWNGDETDRGLRFFQQPEVVRVKMDRF